LELALNPLLCLKYHHAEPARQAYLDFQSEGLPGLQGGVAGITQAHRDGLQGFVGDGRRNRITADPIVDRLPDWSPRHFRDNGKSARIIARMHNNVA
jgi:hypothetical protein